jgi:hypothetical protein
MEGTFGATTAAHHPRRGGGPPEVEGRAAGAYFFLGVALAPPAFSASDMPISTPLTSAV